MELYTLNPNNAYRHETIIERFESFIWTDRYSAHGDLTLVVEPTDSMFKLLQPDTLIAFDESDRVMMIESILKTVDAEGKSTLTAKGKSLEWVLDGRPAKKVLNANTWDLAGTVGLCVTYMVNQICVQGLGVTVDDVIPRLTVSDLTGTTDSSFKISIKSGTVYERVKEICDAFDFGFRITRVKADNTLNFAAYKGTNRSGQGGVAFSVDQESLAETSYLVSKEGFKTGAYVFSNGGSRMVSATGGGVVGLKRKILLVDATDIDLPAGNDLNLAMDQRGRDELSKHLALTLMDGVIGPNSKIRYNTHYFLGDIVNLRGEFGMHQNVRVTEHIWAYDTEGFRSYPTFSAIGGV